MRKKFFLSFLIFFYFNFYLICFAVDLKVFQGDNRLYGLKSDNNEIIVKPQYKKIICLGEKNWIIQNKKRKYGVMKNDGTFIIPPKYTYAERLFDRYIKLGNKSDYGLYDVDGKVIIPPEYSLIEPFWAHMFLTCQKYKYGIYNSDGVRILQNRYDNIYMPTPNELRIQYKNIWYSFKRNKKSKKFDVADNIFDKHSNENILTPQNVLVNTGTSTSYGIITATDYTLKIFSSISDAYETTIDELTLSNGLDAVPVLMNFSWIPKFPHTYLKNYYFNIITPNKSPLSGVRNNLKEQLK